MFLLEIEKVLSLKGLLPKPGELVVSNNFVIDAVVGDKNVTGLENMESDNV